MVYQDMSHDLGRHRKEVRAILPVNVLLVHESHVIFVDQRRSLTRMILSLSPHKAAGMRRNSVSTRGIIWRAAFDPTRFTAAFRRNACSEKLCGTHAGRFLQSNRSRRK